MIISSQESYHQADSDTSTGQRLDFGLHNLEKGKAAKKNEGFFEKGLLKAMESEHRSGRNVTEVKAVGNGHAHCKRLGKTVKLIGSELIGGIVTENCRRVKGVWLCFGGGGWVTCIVNAVPLLLTVSPQGLTPDTAG